jgi:hypothetical protein
LYSSISGVKGSDFGVKGSAFGVQGSDFGVQGSDFGSWSVVRGPFRFGIWDCGLRI